MHRYKRYFHNYSKITKELVDYLLTDGLKLEDFYSEEAQEMDKGIAETFGSEYPKFMQISKTRRK